MTEIAWEDAVQGLGMAMSTVRIYRQRVLQTVTSLRVVSLVFRGHDLRKEATLSLWKKLVPRESGGNMEMGLGLHIKGVLPYVRTELH